MKCEICGIKEEYIISFYLPTTNGECICFECIKEAATGITTRPQHPDP